MFFICVSMCFRFVHICTWFLQHFTFLTYVCSMIVTALRARCMCPTIFFLSVRPWFLCVHDVYSTSCFHTCPCFLHHFGFIACVPFFIPCVHHICCVCPWCLQHFMFFTYMCPSLLLFFILFFVFVFRQGSPLDDDSLRKAGVDDAAAVMVMANKWVRDI